MAFSSVASADNNSIINNIQTPSVLPAQQTSPTTRLKPAFPIRITHERKRIKLGNTIQKNIEKVINNNKINKVKNIYNQDKNVIDNFRAEVKAKIKNGELTPKEAYIQIQRQMKVRITKARSEMKTIREEFKKKIGTKNISLRNIFKLKHEAIVKFVQSKQNDFNQEVEANKEEAKVKINARRLLFLRGLERVKNLKKRVSIENISNRIQVINTKVVDVFTRRINRLDFILASIESRTDKVAVNNIDVSAIRNTTTYAETAISNARASIANQATKVYTISITSESTAKATVEKVRDDLKENIKASQDLIKLAETKVRDSLNLLSKIPKVNELNVPVTVETGNSTSSKGVKNTNPTKQ